jgi:hypothetical protein
MGILRLENPQQVAFSPSFVAYYIYVGGFNGNFFVRFRYLRLSQEHKPCIFDSFLVAVHRTCL